MPLRSALPALLLLLLTWTSARAQSAGSALPDTARAALAGRVLDAATGEPLPGVNVAVRAGGRLRGGASTDADGRFRIGGLPGGVYAVRATAIGYAPGEQRLRLAAGEARRAAFSLQEREVELGEIVVRGAEGRDAAPATVQRLPLAEMQRQDPATVADVGRLLPAAHVQTNSRGQTLLYLRGAGERQVAQFFDGALLNVPWDNRVDLGMLPAAMLERATVSKGVPSVRYGANALGGAVNFQSRALERPGRRTEARGALGTPEAGRASLLHLGRQGRLDYAGAVSFAAQGDAALPRRADLPFSQPSASGRTNTDRRVASGFARAAYQLGGGTRLSASLLHVDAEKGVAPESNVDPAMDRVRYWRYPTWRQTMLIVSGEALVGAERFLRGAVWGSRFGQTIDQHESVAYDRLKETQEDTDHTAGARLLWEQPAGPGALTLALNGLATQHEQRNAAYEDGAAQPATSATYRQYIYSLGAEYALPLTRRAKATLGAGLDGTAITDTGPWEDADPAVDAYVRRALGLTAGLAYEASHQLTLRASAGRKARFPTMRELFGAALGRFVPSPDLRPVTALLGEVGARWHPGRQFESEATLFLSRTYDAIDQRTIQNGPDAGKDQRINLGGSRVWGAEWVAAARPTERLALDGHLTWMRPRGFLDGSPRKLDEKPAWLSTLTLTYDLPGGFAALAQAEYLGGVYARTQENTFDRLPDALVFDARLSYALPAARLGGASGEVFLRVSNLTDELRLLQLGLPGPGREWQGGLKLVL